MVVAYFYPEIGSAAHVYHDLAKAFVRKGHLVTVLTSYPRDFNLDKSDQGKEFPVEDEVDGIKIRRSKHFAMRDFPLLRGLEHFFLPRFYFKEYKKMKEKFDVCLMYIPPLPLYQLAQKIKKYDGTPSVLNYQDFHPQELIDVNYGGIKRNYPMIKILEYMEKESYETADYITVLSDGGVDYVVNKGADPSKVSHIFNGTNLSDIRKYKNKIDFKRKEGIENKFLVSYAGILSPFQGIDNILKVAKELKEEENIIFYIVGDGMIFDELKSIITDENISNVKLMSFQPREEYFNIVNSSDVSIVSLDDRMKAPCLPGKLTNLFAMSQPIIGIVPGDSETAKTIMKSKSGYAIKPGDTKTFKELILKLKDNKELRTDFGKNGYDFLKKNMDLDKSVLNYHSIFASIKKMKTKEG